MAAPERFAERQIPLASRAPSIHGTKRRIAATQQFGRDQGEADIERQSCYWCSEFFLAGLGARGAHIRRVPDPSSSSSSRHRRVLPTVNFSARNSCPAADLQGNSHHVCRSIFATQ